MNTAYLKIPVEMAQFALSARKSSQVGTYVASQFLYCGNAHSSGQPAYQIAGVTDYSPRTVRRHFKWLIDRNWFGRNGYGRYYFRGLDRIHEIENWTFARAAIMHPQDLQTIKAFMAGVVLASLAQTREGQRREQLIPRSTNRSRPPAAPISLSVIADTLDVSESTAYRLRKLAHTEKYIKNELNLIEITNWTPNDLTELKKQDCYNLPVELLGYSDRRIAAIDRIRYEDDKLFLQEPNLVKPLLQLKSRKGLSKYQPYRGYK